MISFFCRRFSSTNLLKPTIEVSGTFSPGNNLFSPSSVCSSRSESIQISQNPKPTSVFYIPYPISIAHHRPTTIPKRKINTRIFDLQTPFEQKPRNPNDGFIRYRPYSITDFKSQTPLEENLKNQPNRNFIRSCPCSIANFKSQTPLEENFKNHPSLNFIRSYSRSPPGFKSQTKPKQKPKTQNSNSCEQEGTVEKDGPEIANEVRETLENLRKSVYDLSNSVALLGLVQLSCGAWIFCRTYGRADSSSSLIAEVLTQSFAAAGFPLVFAYLLRVTLKRMTLKKMEEQGRLQIRNLTVEIVSILNNCFMVVCEICFFCWFGVLIGLRLA